jgi:uncharacterized membrane protein YhfC
LLACLASHTRAAEQEGQRPSLSIRVDPRIELISTIFHLAGNPEYNMCRVPSYESEVQQHFESVQGHPAVTTARRLRAEHGVSFDAPMSLAVHLTDDRSLQLRVPLEPWPATLDQRWQPEDVTDFLEKLRSFVDESDFWGFFDAHEPVHRGAARELESVLADAVDLGWFESFFGEGKRDEFRLVPSLLNGAHNYGPRFPGHAVTEIYCILGVPGQREDGSPAFSRAVIPTIIHEFCHSYANPVADRHAAELEGPAKKLFARVEMQMRRNAYGAWETMMRESLVRASVIRYLATHEGEAAARQQTRQDRDRGFLWIEPLSELFEEYEASRDEYPTLDSFAARIVAFFQEYVEPSKPKPPPTVPPGVVRSLLVSGTLMVLLALAFVVVTRLVWAVPMRWFFAGAAIWIAGVALKAAWAAGPHGSVLAFLENSVPRLGYLIAGSLYVGGLTGIFEIGVTLAAALIWRKLSRTAARAVAVGVGAGAIEAILLGAGGSAGALALMLNTPGMEALSEDLAATGATSALWLIGPAERAIAILCHTGSRVLVLLAVVSGRRSLFWYGFLILTGLDAITGYVHVGGLMESVNLWWLELALLPFALLSVAAVRRCVRGWPRVEEAAEAGVAT